MGTKSCSNLALASSSWWSFDWVCSPLLQNIIRSKSLTYMEVSVGKWDAITRLSWCQKSLMIIQSQKHREMELEKTNKQTTKPNLFEEIFPLSQPVFQIWQHLFYSGSVLCRQWGYWSMRAGESLGKRLLESIRILCRRLLIVPLPWKYTETNEISTTYF